MLSAVPGGPPISVTASGITASGGSQSGTPPIRAKTVALDAATLQQLAGNATAIGTALEGFGRDLMANDSAKQATSNANAIIAAIEALKKVKDDLEPAFYQSKLMTYFEMLTKLEPQLTAPPAKSPRTA